MLHGRAREIAHIDALLDAAREGQSSALLLHGEPGIGKTALLRAGTDTAGGLGFEVLRTRGFESESDIAFAGLFELLAPLLHLRDRIPEVQARALSSALALEPPSPFDRFAVPAGMLSLLAAAAEDGPVLAVVDDVHWMDAASREAVAFVARRLGQEGVVLLLATRPEEGVVEAFAGVEVLEVCGLEAEAARALLQEQVKHELADEVAENLMATAAGNPLALVEIPRSLTKAQLAGREPLAGPLPAGESIERAFGRRLADLPDDARRALLIASAMETGRIDIFRQALAERGLPADALTPAEDAGLVSLDGRIEFQHPLLRSTTYHAARPDERRDVHEVLAKVAPDAARRAWHLAIAATSPDEAVAAALEEAAHEARARGGQDEAAHAFERAAALSTDPARKAARLLEAAMDYSGAGDPDHAIKLVEEAEGLAPDGDLGIQLVRVRGRVEMRRGAPLVAHDAVMAEARRVQDAQPVAAASLMVEAAVAHMMTGDMEGLIRAGEGALALLPEGEHPVIAGLANVLVGEAYAALGDAEEADALLDPLVPMLTGEHVLTMPAEIVGMAGMCGVWSERWDRAQAVLDRLVAAARDASAINHLIYPLAAHAILDYRRGLWQGAYADASESARLARETGNHGLLTFSLAVLALVEAASGRSDDARAHAREAIRLSEQLGGTAIGVYAMHALGLDALGSGDAQEATEHLERASRAARRIRMTRSLVQFGADHVEALMRASRTEEAHTAFEHFTDMAGGGRWGQAAIARCRGLLAEGDYEDHFDTALAHHERDGQPFEKARTQLVYGERLRRDRRRADAREQLSEALDTFERLGAPRWAERTKVELRATGGQQAEGTDAEKAAVAAAGLEELTAHELQIARLVAYGMTNREVAAKLFLSPKTIEYHLSQIYRKLDLRGRAQLASLMSAELPSAA